jgi:SAM-dependent methyltransferase
MKSSRAQAPGELKSRGDDKTTQTHWEDAWSTPPRMRLPPPWNLSVRNAKRLLKKHVRPGARFLEIGCAPGKVLAWVASALGAQVAGIDASEKGIGHARRLFATLRIPTDLRQEDVRSHTLPRASFDVVYSCGLVEHFTDPAPLVRIHVELVKPGGKTLIAIPNYSGWWGAPHRWLDPEVLEWHNCDIMSPAALQALAPRDLVGTTRAYRAGRLSLSHVVPTRVIPAPISRLIHALGDCVGLLQPRDVPLLAPMLVLEMTRR